MGDAEHKDYEFTTVIVPEGSSNGDRILAAIGHGTVQFVEVSDGYDALVIVGSDAA